MVHFNFWSEKKRTSIFGYVSCNITASVGEGDEDKLEELVRKFSKESMERVYANA